MYNIDDLLNSQETLNKKLSKIDANIEEIDSLISEFIQALNNKASNEELDILLKKSQDLTNRIKEGCFDV